MDDLAKAIEEHSHYEGDSDLFWQSMFDKYWDKYIKQTAHPSFSDFYIWCEDSDLVGEDEVYA